MLDLHQAIQPFTGVFDLPESVPERVERVRDLLEWNQADLKPKEPPTPNWSSRTYLKEKEALDKFEADAAASLRSR